MSDASSGHRWRLPRELSSPADVVAGEGGDVWVAEASGILARVSATTFRVERIVPADVSHFTSLTLADGKVWAAGGPLGESFGFAEVSGSGGYRTRPLQLTARFVATRPDGGLVVAGGPLGEIATYGVEGSGDGRCVSGMSARWP